ncbi:hypothetical protein B7L88_gp109 [Rhizobium phage RHEph10]|uniref:hypothetical protein n=1 Tax=Rhizobium phage RHEph10 TaxID=1220717 RepID=UPI0002AB4979|nr:hypothetical protein B7L88_gp109 [Rhizobium phage RHEph10]AGC36179.1 hypothetical protein RHEph10_gp136 [Rhizobium phage RHEph10]
MRYFTTFALLFLTTAPGAQALTITDETPARAITIGKPSGDLSRLVVAPEVISMKECRDALLENAEALKENSVAMLCVPADMTEPGRPSGDLPFIDLQ